jgi:hypothetical protein
MRHILLASLVGPLLLTSSAFAANDDATTTGTPAVATVASTVILPDLEANVTSAPRIATDRRPLMLPVLYVNSGFLQGYDVYSTLTVLKHGGTEANPLMKEITRSPVVFIGLKAGVTMMSIIAAERMWKDDNRLGAVLMMVASNGFMAIVAVNNAAVLQRVRRAH